MITVIYNNLNLTTGLFNVTDYDGYNPAKRELKVIELARTDGSVLVSDRYKDKEITISGQIKASTKIELEQTIKTLKQYMYPSERTLSVTGDDGITLNWEATPQSPIITRQRGAATMALWSIVFYCPKPYSITDAVYELLNTNITSQDVDLGLTVLGTYPAAPEIQLTINSITTGQQSITIRNGVAARGITITSEFTAGDTVTINSKTLRAYLNNDRINYTGTFPKWDAGAGSLNYVDTASARDVDIVVTAEQRDL